MKYFSRSIVNCISYHSSMFQWRGFFNSTIKENWSTCRFCVVNAMATDDLATLGARLPTNMALTTLVLARFPKYSGLEQQGYIKFGDFTVVLFFIFTNASLFFCLTHSSTWVKKNIADVKTDREPKTRGVSKRKIMLSQSWLHSLSEAGIGSVTVAVYAFLPPVCCTRMMQ